MSAFTFFFKVLFTFFHFTFTRKTKKLRVTWLNIRRTSYSLILLILEMIFKSVILKKYSRESLDVVVSEGDWMNWVAFRFSSVSSIIFGMLYSVWEALMEIIRKKKGCLVFQQTYPVLFVDWSLIRGKHWVFSAVVFSFDFTIIIILQYVFTYSFCMDCINNIAPPSIDVVWVNE